MIKRSGQLQLTSDKRGIKDFSKLPWATSFIRKTLYTRGEANKDFSSIFSFKPCELSGPFLKETCPLERYLGRPHLSGWLS